MICKGISIQWDRSIEYIALDFSCLEQPISLTLEWWQKEKIWVKYNTRSHLIEQADGSYELVIAHAPDENRHLEKHDLRFGETIISIFPGKDYGRAFWRDNSGPEESGESTWELVKIPLVGEKKKEHISRIQRNQQEFRSALVALDERCVLTGETTVSALEAAHIISASYGGSEVIENGILLRADIHRLFDAGGFSIRENGKVMVGTGLSDTYELLLKDKSLPSSAFTRVSDALKHVSVLGEDN